MNLAPAPSHSPHRDADVGLTTPRWDWPGAIPAPRSSADVLAGYFLGATTPAEVEAIGTWLRRHLADAPAQSRRWAREAEAAARFWAGVGRPPLVWVEDEPDLDLTVHPVPAPEVRMPRGDAAPDPELWATAVDLEPRIAGAAERALGMPSPSEHDMSLAHHLGGLGWAGQDIADAIAWVRRRRGEKPKHVAYFRHTIRRALEGQR